MAHVAQELLCLLQDFLAALLRLQDDLAVLHHRCSLALRLRADVLRLAPRVLDDLVALLHDVLCLIEFLRQVIAQFLDVVDEVVIVDEDVAREREGLGRGHHVLDLI